MGPVRDAAFNLSSQLEAVQFAERGAAYSRLQRLGDHLARIHAGSAKQILEQLCSTLADSASPDRALVNMERFLEGSHSDALTADYLARHPRAIGILVTLFSGSQFLTEILLRIPEYLRPLVEHRRLASPKTVAQLTRELRDALNVADNGTVHPPADPYQACLDRMRRFQRWELLRIGTVDLLGLSDLPTTTQQLSNLADCLIATCLDAAAAQVAQSPAGFAVIAMGKLGGQELNYSSDIDLLFVAEANAENYRRMGERLIDALSRSTGEGFLYRVDMRLRPWGRSGALISSLDGYRSYLLRHGRTWEKQALLKARPVAGDLTMYQRFEAMVEPILASLSPETVRADARAMKEQTEAHLRLQGRTWGEVKLGEGSIRDVEFVAQVLQLSHRSEGVRIHSRNTLEALSELAAAGYLTTASARILSDGYIFLRTIENYLQMMHYAQTHTLPDSSDALAYLARRLGFAGTDSEDSFTTRYEQHRTAIRRVYLDHIGGDAMNTLRSSPRGVDGREPTGEPAPAPRAASQQVARLAYAGRFTEQERQQHAALADRLSPSHLVEVEATELAAGRWRVTIVGYDYPGELSLICGLLFVYGCSIIDGDVYTFEAGQFPIVSTAPPATTETRRKITDVFTVYPIGGTLDEALWQRYAEELHHLLALMEHGQRRDARGEVAKRVAKAVHTLPRRDDTLYPVEIEIDNSASDEYTVLHINAPDTIGFLYELTNALAYSRIYIARVSVDSIGDRVCDTLYVTDVRGQKITSLAAQHELRVTTVLIKHFTHLLPHSPDPETALLHFRELLSQQMQRPNWIEDLVSLERHEVLEALARLLGVSEFLWDDFLRMQHANLFPVVQDVDSLNTAKSRHQLQAELEATLRPVHDGPQLPAEVPSWRDTLNAFKDREMFRIDMRHILGHTQEFWDFSEELTALAEVVVNCAYHLGHEDLRLIYGSPHLPDGRIDEMAVCALGKCGGRELGFASDIELMFIYAGRGETSGPQVISAAEFYEKLVQLFVNAIQAKREGIFEIDLQLRPYGKSSALAVQLDSFRRYFAPDGPAWAYERQALVKLRPIAGDPALGEEIVGLRDAYVYNGEAFDVVAMRAMRERQVRHLVTGGSFNAKYSPGGLVDVEYLVQGLQITHGHCTPDVRRTNIREAMAALAAADVMTEAQYTQLHRAHTFLRWLIDGLRMVRGNARDLTVPDPGSEAFAYLARRLQYGDEPERLPADLAAYTQTVHELNAQLLR